MVENMDANSMELFKAPAAKSCCMEESSVPNADWRA
jgi:hypothetical protein